MVPHPRSRWGVPHPRSRGTPSSWLAGTPSQVQPGRYPIQLGVPHLRSRYRVPHPRSRWEMPECTKLLLSHLDMFLLSRSFRIPDHNDIQRFLYCWSNKSSQSSCHYWSRIHLYLQWMSLNFFIKGDIYSSDSHNITPGRGTPCPVCGVPSVLSGGYCLSSMGNTFPGKDMGPEILKGPETVRTGQDGTSERTKGWPPEVTWDRDLEGTWDQRLGYHPPGGQANIFRN